MDSLLITKEVECRNLRGELSRRDSTTQKMELKMFSMDQGLKHREEELQYARTEIMGLEKKLMDATSALSETKQRLEKERMDRKETEAKALEVTNSMMETQKKLMEKDIEYLRSEISVCKQECKMLTEDKALSSARNANLERELDRKTRQGHEAGQKILELKAKCAKLKQDHSSEVLPDMTPALRKELNELQINSEAAILSLETKLDQKRDYVTQLEEEKRLTESKLEAEVQQLKLDLEALESKVREKETEFSALNHQLVLKQTEVMSLRERLGTETPKKVQRTSSREDLLVQQIQRLTRQIEEIRKDQQDNGCPVSWQSAVEEIGSLKTSNRHMENRISELEANTEKLKSELEMVRIEREELKEEVEGLQKILDEKENDTGIVHSYLLDDISKVKQQKADLRIRYIELEREFAKLKQGEAKEKRTGVEDEIKRLKKELTEKQKSEEAAKQQLDEVQRSVDRATEALEGAKLKIDGLFRKNQDLRRELEEMSRASDRCSEHLKSQLKNATAEKQALSDACLELDKQCSELDKIKEKYKKKADELAQRIENEERSSSSVLDELATVKRQVQMLQREKTNAERKADSLQEELVATHVDYKGEFAVLAKQIRDEMASSHDNADQLFALESTISQLQKENRKLKMDLEESQHSKEEVLAETDVLSDRLTEMCEKAATLEAALSQAIDKGERYKSEKEESQRRLELVEKETEEEKVRMGAEISQQGKLLADLNTPSKKKHWTGAAPENDGGGGTELNDMRKMLSEERRTASDLKAQVKNLEGLLKEEQTKAYRMQSSGLGRSKENVFRPMSALSFSSEVSSQESSNGAGLGTMRHNIPHKWKRFLVLRPSKCLVCMDGLPLVRHALKCSECHIVVHSGCSASLFNMCGLPMLYTDYYLEQQKNSKKRPGVGSDKGFGSLQGTPSAEGRMTGWVKLFRTNRPSEKWIDSWGYMDESKLAFFPKEDVTSEPIEELTLDTQKWKIHFQRGVEPQDAKSVNSDDVPYLVEIKVTPDNGSEPYRLYLMAPTFPAKQRWVNALQVATNRRMFARRLSSLRLQQNSFLRLDEPHNLRVSSVCVLDESDILMGCDDGLYFTELKNPGIPDKISGIGKVFQLEVLAERGMVVVIAGQDRSLGFIHLTELRQSIRDRHPGVKVTMMTDLILCHLFVSVQCRDQTYLCVADPEKVHVLSFSKKLEIFTHHKVIETKEPTACITQIDESILIGADKFFLADLSTGDFRELLDAEDSSLEYAALKAPFRQDFPIDAVVVRSENGLLEILLSYQNFALFVDLQGRRTRRNDIDWVRSPLYFVYSAPYLYVLHYESVEIFEIPAFNSPETPPAEPMSLLDVASPRLLGKGLSDCDVFISSSKMNVTEILLLNSHGTERPGAKRKVDNKSAQEAGKKRSRCP